MTIMPLLNAFLILALIVVCSSSARAQVHEVQLTTTLSNHNEFPLVGLGVGNLEHDLINDQIFKGLEKHRNYRLVDTAHASKNEHLVRDRRREWIENWYGATTK